ncbi:hypothetical protein SLEP1_g27788 [Rubroshorea leprosula]|uniref:Uncharacterized protein n=1 Tax=Rubroshorea leprosula TaxID=152421 RepID=A0AAV5K0U0_9ROSI|nr:hypothetical protein SLEP1_g27788 [Rubroshorea leprosula]
MLWAENPQARSGRLWWRLSRASGYPRTKEEENKEVREGSLRDNGIFKQRSRLNGGGFLNSSSIFRFGETLDLEFVNLKFEFRFIVSWSFRVFVQVASEVSSDAGGETINSDNGRKVPPRRTVSTATWHTWQFPIHSSPTAPFIGFTILLHASNSKD